MCRWADRRRLGGSGPVGSGAARSSGASIAAWLARLAGLARSSGASIAAWLTRLAWLARLTGLAAVSSASSGASGAAWLAEWVERAELVE
ncbi:MAG: hypothetical protein ACRDSH_04600 [Pseudonocardiaceae bacterium]